MHHTFATHHPPHFYTLHTHSSYLFLPHTAHPFAPPRLAFYFAYTFHMPYFSTVPSTCSYNILSISPSRYCRSTVATSSYYLLYYLSILFCIPLTMVVLTLPFMQRHDSCSAIFMPCASVSVLATILPRAYALVPTDRQAHTHCANITGSTYRTSHDLAGRHGSYAHRRRFCCATVTLCAGASSGTCNAEHRFHFSGWFAFGLAACCDVATPTDVPRGALHSATGDGRRTG